MVDMYRVKDESYTDRREIQDRFRRMLQQVKKSRVSHDGRAEMKQERNERLKDVVKSASALNR